MGFERYIKDITFDRENLLFAAGESITGSLRLMAREGAHIYDLQLLLSGTVCRFIPRKLYPMMESIKVRNFSPEAAHAIHYFQVNENGTNLPPQEMVTLPFVLKIPENVPSSFDRGSDGHISYSFCLIGKPHSNSLSPFESFCYAREVKIVGLVPPTKSGFSKPVTRKVQSTQKNGDATMKVHLEKTCCTPGETFSFKVQVENNLRLPLSSIKMIFMAKIFKYLGGMDRNKLNPTEACARSTVLGMNFTKEGPSVPPGPGRKINWDGSFTVPHVVPSGLGFEGFKSFDVQYFLQFSLKNFVNLTINIPIHIGTSPKLLSGEDNEIEISAYESFIGSAQGMSTRSSSMSSISSIESGWISTLDLLSESDDDTSSRRSSFSGASSSFSRRSAPPSYRSQYLPTPTRNGRFYLLHLTMKLVGVVLKILKKYEKIKNNKKPISYMKWMDFYTRFAESDNDTSSRRGSFSGRSSSSGMR